MHAGAGKPLQIGMGEDAALGDDNAIGRHQRRETLGGRKRGGEGLEIAIVDADELRVELERPVKLGLVMHFGEHVHAADRARPWQGLAPSRRRPPP